MKITFLWTHFSDYLTACFDEITKQHDAKIQVAHFPVSPESPYEDERWLKYHLFALRNPRFVDIELLKFIENFSPDAVVVLSWYIRPYRYVLRHLPDTTVRICALDNQWHGRLRQWLGVVTAPMFIRRYYDAMFFPGDRQETFALKMGFHGDQLIRGLYSCDTARFHETYDTRWRTDGEQDRGFIFVGRLVADKGIPTLLAAYRQYRTMCVNPRPLIVCGVGPLRQMVENCQGVVYRGFVQPAELPREFMHASCLILPSNHENWGVCIHEAASAGCAVIATHACGAAVHLVRDGYNGYIVEPGNVSMLASRMLLLSQIDVSKRREMMENSYKLSQQFSPALWASNLLDGIERVKSNILNR